MKDDFVRGLETILNNKDASFIRNPRVFSELHKQSGMSVSSMIKHLGKQDKKVKKEKEDAERGRERLERLDKK